VDGPGRSGGQRVLRPRPALTFVQLDVARVAGVNENLAILLLAAKFGIPVCPHAGGVGPCELVEHLAMRHHGGG
jgi:L-alanine-DL-glutamate epimerase-like enolase superfamily enzyme